MIPYGLTKNMSYRVHSHNKCGICCSTIEKRLGRKKARAEKKKIIRKYIKEEMPS